MFETWRLPETFLGVVLTMKHGLTTLSDNTRPTTTSSRKIQNLKPDISQLSPQLLLLSRTVTNSPSCNPTGQKLPLHCFQSVANSSKVIFLFPRKIRSCPSYTDLSSPWHRGLAPPELKHRIRLLQGMSQHLPIYSQNLRQGLLLPFP